MKDIKMHHYQIMKLSISNIAWSIEDRKKIYQLLTTKNIEGLTKNM